MFTEPIIYTHGTSTSVPFSLFDHNLGQLLSVEYARISGVSNSWVYARNLSGQEGQINSSGRSARGYYSRTPSVGETLMFSYSGGGSPALSPFQDWTLIGGGGLDGEGSYTQYYSGQELDQFIGTGTFDLAPRTDIRLNIYDLSPGVEIKFDVNYAFSYAISYI